MVILRNILFTKKKTNNNVEKITIEFHNEISAKFCKH